MSKAKPSSLVLSFSVTGTMSAVRSTGCNGRRHTQGQLQVQGNNHQDVGRLLEEGATDMAFGLRAWLLVCWCQHRMHARCCVKRTYPCQPSATVQAYSAHKQLPPHPTPTQPKLLTKKWQPLMQYSSFCRMERTSWERSSSGHLAVAPGGTTWCMIGTAGGAQQGTSAPVKLRQATPALDQEVRRTTQCSQLQAFRKHEWQ
jgi:hypothetical protein